MQISIPEATGQALFWGCMEGGMWAGAGLSVPES